MYQSNKQINALIAEKIMGWDNNWDNPCEDRYPYMWGIMDYNDEGIIRAANFPDFCENIEDACKVLETLKHLNPTIHYESKNNSWSCILDDNTSKRYMIIAESLPMVICLAALKSVEKEL